MNRRETRRMRMIVRTRRKTMGYVQTGVGIHESVLTRGKQVSLAAIDDSDESDSSVDMEERLPRQPTKKPPTTTKKNGPKSQANDDKDGEDDEEEEEDEEDIPISDLEDLDEEEKEDLIPHTRLTINNTTALLASLNRIALPTDKSVPFATHQCVTSSVETAEAVQDVSDDLQRELAFYSQGLEAARLARSKLRAEGVPFSRPKDYFAEMVKEDAHMEKVKAKLVEEASNKKAAAEARKLRDLKKFGKQVQVAKLQERQKAKRETLEKIKTLKRSKFLLTEMFPCPLIM
jgi:rRNA-processing protein EBP2